VRLWLREHLLKDVDFMNWVQDWLQRSQPGVLVDEGYVRRWLQNNPNNILLQKYENEKYSDPKNIFDVISTGKIDWLSHFPNEINVKHDVTGATQLIVSAER